MTEMTEGQDKVDATEPEAPAIDFASFDFGPRIMEGLDAMGFKKPTPIQEQAIPLAMDGQDMIACAQTGTGKTAAYLLPTIDSIDRLGGGFIHTLIIAPTRELALQIDEQIQGFAYFTNTGCTTVFGGGDAGTWEVQKRALTKGVDIVIATPGRLIAHLNFGYVKFENVRHLILDEADRMLDMGFYEDIVKIISYLPEKRQALLFSATMPPKIRQLAKEIMSDKPAEVSIAIAKPAAGILQAAYLTHDEQKLPLLDHLLKGKDIPSVLVFASTKIKVRELARALQREGYNAKGMQSDLEQQERQAVMNEFYNRKVQILVATDIVSRGIDIDNISLIINYDVPQDAEDYVHRIGRTARADSTGVALTFINHSDMHRFANIESLIEKEVNKVPLPSHLGEGPTYAPGKRGGGGGRRPGGRRQGGGGGNRGRFGSRSKGRGRN